MKKVLLFSFILLFTSVLFASELAIQTTTPLQNISVRQQRINEAGSTEYFNVLRIGPNQGLYLLGENHYYRLPRKEENRKNLNAFVNLLAKAEKDESQGSYHVLVEQASDYKGLQHPEIREVYLANFLTGLIPACNERELHATVVEDAEMRDSMSALSRFLCIYRNLKDSKESDDTPEWVLKQCALFKERTGYNAKELKFADIVSAFDKACDKSEEYIAQWQDPLIKRELQMALDEAREKFEPVRIFISSEGENKTLFSHCSYESDKLLYGGLLHVPGKMFALDETLYHFCKGRGEATSADMCALMSSLVDYIMVATPKLLDIYLIHRVLQLRSALNPVKKIVIISGAAHSQRITLSLIRSKIALHSYAPKGNEFHPSELAKIEMSLEEAEKIEQAKWRCVLQ